MGTNGLKALPFRALAVDEVVRLEADELQAFLTLIYKAIAGDAAGMIVLSFFARAGK